jgi:hypothetical protein
LEFEPLPEGWYTLKIDTTEIKETRSGKGQYLKVEFSVEDNARKHWENFNLWNPSEKAQQIARGQFSALCRAVGKLGLVKDSSELHNKKVLARLKTIPAKDGYPAKNAVVEYKPMAKPAAGIPENDDIRF